MKYGSRELTTVLTSHGISLDFAEPYPFLKSSCQNGFGRLLS